MIGFSYNYKTHEEIFESLPRIFDLGSGDLILVGGSLCVLIICIFLVLPLALIWKKQHNLKREKQNKRKLLAQILLQKELEDEVEKEIQIEDETKVVS